MVDKAIAQQVEISLTPYEGLKQSSMDTPTLIIDGQEVYPYEIDFIICRDANGNETEDYINADEYIICLNDDGLNRLEVGELNDFREELDPTTYELILEFIQPT